MQAGNECDICQKKLSSKQRLTTHLQSVHGLPRLHQKRKYMEYKQNPDVPIPERTRYRHKSKLKGQMTDACAESHTMGMSGENIATASTDSFTAIPSLTVDVDHSSRSFDICKNSTSEETDTNTNESAASCCEAERENLPSAKRNEDVEQDSVCNFESNFHTDAAQDCQQLLITQTDQTASEVCHFSSDNESIQTYEGSISSDFSDEEDALDLVSTDEEFMEEKSYQKQELQSNPDEKCMALLAFLMRYHLSGQASQDLLPLLKFFSDDSIGGDSTVLKNLSINKLKEIVGTCDAEIIHFCEKCFTIFPEDEDVYNCLQVGCSGLRYKGSLSNQKLKQRKNFFACLPVSQQIKDILEGEGVWPTLQKYQTACHANACISDILNAEVYRELQRPGNFLDNRNNISMLFNTDGIPLYRSSGVSIWPVYLVINELPPVIRFARKNMILWGIWQSQGKPVFHTFFQTFVKHMKQLKEDGVRWKLNGKDMITKAILIAGTLDLQAKAYLAEMTMHNGKYGCLTCENPGIVVSQGRGHTRVYPYFDTVEQHKERSAAGLLQCGLQAVESGKVEMGVKGVSTLHGMEWFDMVFGLVPDYMHGVLLGVTKKLLLLMFTSSSANQPYFIGKSVKQLDKILKGMRPNDLISRLPRKLESNIHHLKASEMQTWLLFYSIPCLLDYLPAPYLNHFALFVEGVYILLSDRISRENLNRADSVLAEFYQEFGNLYGENNCTLNLHNVGQHLTTYVRKLGPLWAWSCFPFEDMNGSILEAVHGTGDVCLQILWFIQAQKRLSVDSGLIQTPAIAHYVKSLMSGSRTVQSKQETLNCKIAGGLTKLDAANVPKERICEILGITGELGTISKVLRVVAGDMILFSKQYTRLIKRIGHIVMVSSDTGMEIVAIQYFVYHHEQNKCVAVVKSLKIEDDIPFVHPMVKHLLRVKQIDEEQVVLVEKIKEKVLYLDGNPQFSCVARLPNLFGLCS